MSFAECKKVMGGGTFLPSLNDGESVVFCFLGEPFPLTQSGQYGERTRSVFPVLSTEGVRALAVGSRLFTQIADAWKQLSKGAVKMTRDGEKGDVKTTYKLSPIARPAAMTRLLKKVDKKQLAEFKKRVAGVVERTTDSDVPF